MNQGLAQAVGVSNFSADRVRRASGILQARPGAAPAAVAQSSARHGGSRHLRMHPAAACHNSHGGSCAPEATFRAEHALDNQHSQHESMHARVKGARPAADHPRIVHASKPCGSVSPSCAGPEGCHVTGARACLHACAQAKGVPLASNQVQYSLLYRVPERNGVADACRAAGATLIAYSPLAQGLLTGARRRLLLHVPLPESWMHVLARGAALTSVLAARAGWKR